jgi:AraC-like DNA-binding protein
LSTSSQVAATDATGWQRAFSDFDLDVIQLGAGSRPNRLATAYDRGAAMISADVGFPVSGRATVPEDSVIAVLVTRAPAGMRWCGHDLEAGDVLVYGPGAEHVAVTPGGARFRLVTASFEYIESAAEAAGRHVPPLARGSIAVVRDEIQAASLHTSMAALQPVPDRAESAEGGGSVAVDALLDVMCPADTRPSGRGLDSTAIINAAIEFADRSSTVPPVAELCRAAHVSERRLRTAFLERFGMPPKRYFQHRQLSRVHSALRAGSPSTTSVTMEALNAGVTHLGRFSRRYQSTFGVFPSDSLRTLEGAG